MLRRSIAFVVTFVTLAGPAVAQRRGRPQPASPVSPVSPSSRFDSSLFQSLRWRSIGPYRGGRVTAVAGVSSQPFVYYFGATGGGVWKTTDGGNNWFPVA